MRDLTAALATVDCASPSCPNEADGSDGLCRHCRTVAPPVIRTRDELRALMHDGHPSPAAKPDLLEDIVAIVDDVLHNHKEAAAMGTCRIDGCANPNAGKGGSWGGLCVEHIAIEGRRRQELGHSRKRASSAPKLSSVPDRPADSPRQPVEVREAPPGGTLVQLAHQVEQTKAQLAAAHAAHQEALSALRSALDAAEAA